MLQIEEKLTVTNENVKNWVPDVKVVEGRQYIKIDQWDRSFFRLCTGKALVFKAGASHHQHTSFMDYLMNQRTMASKAAYSAAEQLLQQDGDEGGKKKKRKQARALRMSDAVVAGEAVSVDLSYGGESITISMLFGVKNQVCWVEALPENLKFIAKHLNHDYKNGNVSSRRWNKNDDDDHAESGGEQKGDAEASS